VRDDALRVQGHRYRQAHRGAAQWLGRAGLACRRRDDEEANVIAPPQAIILVREVVDIAKAAW